MANYFYCPIPWTKIEDISVSSCLAPFLWQDQASAPWMGNPAIIFYSVVPSVMGIEDVVYLRVEEDFLPSMGLDVSTEVRGDIKALLFYHVLELIPGAFTIHVDGSEEVRREAIYSFGAGIQQSKYTSDMAQEMILILDEPKRKVKEVVTNRPIENPFDCMLSDRMKAFQLSLYLSRFNYNGQLYWNHMLGLVRLLRSKAAVTRNSFERSGIKQSSQTKELIEEIESILANLVVKDTEVISAWVYHQLDSYWMKNCNDDNCPHSIRAAVDFLINAGDEYIKEHYYRKAVKTSENLGDQQFIWKAWYSLRDDLGNLDHIREFGKIVQAEAFREKVAMFEQGLTQDTVGPFIEISSLCIDLSPEERFVFSLIAKAVICYKPDIQTEVWKKTGFGYEDQIGMIKAVNEAMRAVPSAIYVKEIEEILLNARNSFDSYLFSIPQLSAVMMNFLVFVQNPLDPKRVYDQQQAWNCPYPGLANALQAGFLGFKSIPGVGFHPLFTSISRVRALQEKYFSWIYTNIDKSGKEETAFDSSLGDVGSDCILSNDGIEQQILKLLKESPAGKKLSQIVVFFDCDKKLVQTTLQDLKSRHVIVCESQLWKINAK